MVSPLQARELGYAIACEWSAPGPLLLDDTLPMACHRGGTSAPDELPRSTRPSQPATLGFKGATTARWRRVHNKWWAAHVPDASLDTLCELALRHSAPSKRLPPLRNLVELARVARDGSLEACMRNAAAAQYAEMRRALDARRQREAATLPPPSLMRHLWAQCDDCLQWRRVPLGRDLPSRWSCAVDGVAPFDTCAAPEEPLVPGEVWPEEDAHCRGSDDAPPPRAAGRGAMQRDGASAMGFHGATDDADAEALRVAQIRRHHVYGGARRGSLRSVYVQLAYDDGSTTGRGAFEPAESLCSRPEGVDVLATYLRTARGTQIAKYVPVQLAEACARCVAPEACCATVCDAANGCARVAAHLVRHGGHANWAAGWRCRVATRRLGASAGTTDRYYLDPIGRVHRSLRQVARCFGIGNEAAAGSSAATWSARSLAYLRRQSLMC